MSLVSDPKNQWIAIVEEYLSTAKMLIDLDRADESIPQGYSASHPPGYLRSISRAGSGQTQDEEGQR